MKLSEYYIINIGKLFLEQENNIDTCTFTKDRDKVVVAIEELF